MPPGQKRAALIELETPPVKNYLYTYYQTAVTRIGVK
jgi:hypothetical protein